jgi:hypothetical protein
MNDKLLIILCAMVQFCQAQSDSLKNLSFGLYGELYYSYDFSKPANHEKASYLYNHKRHNELNANLLIIKANYTENKVKANLALMGGNYAQYNLSSEPLWAQFIYEANVGYEISPKRNLWLEAGIFPSHIGFESAISADCWTLTRSLLAENSPYYEAAVKVSHTSKNNKLFLSAMYLNGWQRIQRPSSIQRPSFGTQLTYKPTDHLTFNYSTFLGTDQADSLNAFRQFHNLYAVYEPGKTLGLIAGFDIGRDKYDESKYGNWYSPVLIFRIKSGAKTKLALRGEYYTDPNQIIIATETEKGIDLLGLSSNIDYSFNEKLLLRFEIKNLFSKGLPIFSEKNNYSITTNLTIKL